MLFLIASLIIGTACSVITIKTIVGYTDTKLYYKIAFSVIIVLGWFAVPMMHCLNTYNLIPSVKVYSITSQILYMLTGFVFFLFVLIMLRDIIWYSIYGIAHILGVHKWYLDPKNLITLIHANRIILLLSIILSIFSWYQGNKIPDVKNIYFNSDKISKDIVIAQVSDLHINRATSASHIKELVNEVNLLNPDVIVLTGDIIDDNVLFIDDQIAALKELSAPYGVYSVMGNHEYYHDVYAAKRVLDDAGLKFLFNGGVHIQNSNVFISGIPDMNTMYERINLWRTIYQSTPEDYKILLSHSPVIIDSLSKGLFDLVLAGHTHGGQIFPFHFLIKQANHYIAGQYHINGTDLYVSRGVGTWGPKMRFLAPSDITLIHLSKK